MPQVTEQGEIQESVGFMFNDIVWSVDIPLTMQPKITDFDNFVTIFWQSINNVFEARKEDITQDLHCKTIIEQAKQQVEAQLGITLGEVRAVYSICSIKTK